MQNSSAPQYIFDADTKPEYPLFDVPLIVATDDSVKGYGRLVDDPALCDIEIVKWPAQGWRPVDDGTGSGSTSSFLLRLPQRRSQADVPQFAAGRTDSRRPLRSATRYPLL